MGPPFKGIENKKGTLRPKKVMLIKKKLVYEI